jgi:HPt (histidine-containing phosphotransfer) domain-containing protein
MKEDRSRCLAVGMDDYVSKPIDPDYLLQRLEDGAGNAGEEPAGTAVIGAGQTASVASFDFEVALKRARGKRAFLVQLTQVFLNDLPNTLAEIHAAMQVADMQRLERAAHRLKGGAATLAAGPVAAAAAELEQLCKDDALDVVQDTVARIEVLVSHLMTELETMVEGTV